jgi:hypothetical protein
VDRAGIEHVSIYTIGAKLCSKITILFVLNMF